MTNRIVGCHFEGNDIGVSAGENTPLSVEHTSFKSNGIGIQFIEAKKNLLKENFEAHVTEEDVAKIASELRASKVEDYPAIIKKFDFDKWLKRGVDISTIISKLMPLF